MNHPVRQKIVDDIVLERQRHLDLPGSEFDARHSRNDWIAIAANYLTESATRRNHKIDPAIYRANLVKSAAVIVAALEYLDSSN